MKKLKHQQYSSYLTFSKINQKSVLALPSIRQLSVRFKVGNKNDIKQGLLLFYFLTGRFPQWVFPTVLRQSVIPPLYGFTVCLNTASGFFFLLRFIRLFLLKQDDIKATYRKTAAVSGTIWATANTYFELDILTFDKGSDRNIILSSGRIAVTGISKHNTTQTQSSWLLQQLKMPFLNGDASLKNYNVRA